MPSENYRYYHLDGDGSLHCAEWFSAASEEDAILRVQANHPNSKCELWRGSRLVARLSPSQFSPDDPDLQNAVGERLSALALRMELGLET